MKRKVIKFMTWFHVFVLFMPNLASASVALNPGEQNHMFRYGVSADKTSAVANNIDLIALTFTQEMSSLNYIGGCVGPYTYINVTVSGTGNTLSANRLTYANTAPEGQGAYMGTYGSLTLKSTVPGVKTITIQGGWENGESCDGPFTRADDRQINGGSVTFTAPPTAAATPRTTATPRVTATPAPTPTPTLEKPKVPVLANIEVDGTQYEGENLKDLETKEFEKGENITFSGTTVPNAKVTLYFHSDPFEDTAIADSDGNWNYTLKEDIGSGKHSLQIAVTDPKTNVTSDKSEALTFNIKEETKKLDEPCCGVAPTPFYLEPISWMGIIFTLLVIGFGSWFGYKKYKEKKAGKETKKTVSEENASL